MQRPEDHGGDPAPETREVLERLTGRAAGLRLIQETLRPGMDEQEVRAVFLSGLICDRGFGYSRAILFDHDPGAGDFRASQVYGAADREAHERLRAEIEAEDRSVEDTVGQLSEVEGADPEQADALQTQMADLRRHSFWITMRRVFESEHPRALALSGLTLPCLDRAAGAGGADSWFARLIAEGGVEAVDRAAIVRAGLPERLAERIGEASIWTRIPAGEGRGLILIVDRAFDDRDLDLMDRFLIARVGERFSMALQNAELNSRLARMNVDMRELDALKGTFLSTISHELRNPLTAITGFTRLLVNNKVGEISSSQKQLLERVLTHAERLVSVVNDLIEIVEIDAGAAVNVTVCEVDPLDALMGTLPKLEPRRASRSVSIEPIVTGPVPLIRADRGGLERIFYHLIDNAIKFTEENGRVKIEFVPGENDLSIQIVDKGIGIAPDRLRRIFEAFYQVDSTLGRVYEGMGIGLTLTNKLVAATGGRLVVQSELGRGSTFTVIYPQA